VADLPPNFTLLQVIPELETGGAEQTTLDVARAVLEAGGRALVATQGGRMAEGLAQTGGELVPLPVATKNPLVMALNARRLARLIREERVSVVHARSRAPAFSALRAARATGVPFVSTYHGVYNARSALKRRWNAVMTRGDLVIANSEFTRQHVIDEHGVNPERVVAIPRGLNLDWFDPAKVDRERVRALCHSWAIEADDPGPKILLAGRLTRWKGQGLMIDALARMASQGGPNLMVLMAGDDQGRKGYREHLEQAIVNNGLSDSVRLVGHADDMPAAYRLAELAAAPSTDPEAFGRTAVEPQAMERPVLAADHGAVRETVVDGETGWRVPPGDVDAWAGALVQAVEAGPDRWAEMGRAGRERVQRLYSVQAMTDATLEVYRRVLGPSTSSG
jgi:glycosyltransferase involved in cell wall biosynthesis